MKIFPKFLFWTVGTLVITGMISGFLAFSLTMSALRQYVEGVQYSEAVRSMDTVDRFLYERYNDIQSIASKESIGRFLAGSMSKTGHGDAVPPEFRREMTDLLVLTGPWETIDVVGRDGLIAFSTVASSTASPIVSSEEDGQAFHRALEGGIVYSDAVVDERLHRVTVLFAAPIRDPDHFASVVGVVLAHLSWPALTELLPDSGSQSFRLRDAHGHIIAQSEGFSGDAVPTSGEVGAEGSSIDDGPDGQMFVSHALEKGYLTYRGNGWSLLLREPVAAAYGPSKWIALQSSLLLFVISLLCAVVVAGSLRRLITPLHVLTESVRRFGKDGKGFDGLLVDAKEALNSGDEVGDLATTFNDMAKRISEERAGLEKKVEERTSALQRKMAELEEMNRLMVGREVKMAEMKKRLAELEEKDEKKG